jgi:uncharacterized oxidoreductase
MQLTAKTILITGGTSGIGFELASQLLDKGNTVIITGRDQQRLDDAQKRLPTVKTILADVSDPAAVAALQDTVAMEYPALNVLVNNAGIMRKINLNKSPVDLKDLTREIETNLNGTIWMASAFLPLLKKQPSATIVNVSSGLAFVPLALSPIYCATKAAIHAYTQSLRIQLKNTNVAVVELAPPGTETPLFRDEFTKEDVGNVKTMPVKTLAERAIAGIEKGTLEIRPGLSNMLKIMSRVAPGFIFKQLNGSIDNMLKEQN